MSRFVLRAFVFLLVVAQVLYGLVIGKLYFPSNGGSYDTPLQSVDWPASTVFDAILGVLVTCVCGAGVLGRRRWAMNVYLVWVIAGFILQASCGYASFFFWDWLSAIGLTLIGLTYFGFFSFERLVSSGLKESLPTAAPGDRHRFLRCQRTLFPLVMGGVGAIATVPVVTWYDGISSALFGCALLLASPVFLAFLIGGVFDWLAARRAQRVLERNPIILYRPHIHKI